jgi:ABC-type dipeptide/oligopeptide/nickel transport system ATPase component
MEFIEFLQLIKSRHIIGIIGELGDGKSILGVSIVYLLKSLSEYTNTPKFVKSNIPLTFDHELLEYYDQMEGMQNSLIFIDEIHLVADSRQSHDKSNFFVSGITTDVRKAFNKLFWTSQESSQVELRVKNRTTLFLKPVHLWELIFEVSVISQNRHLLGTIVLNLEAFKDEYNTNYIPQSMMTRENEED